jgi:hypothetical protein
MVFCIALLIVAIFFGFFSGIKSGFDAVSFVIVLAFGGILVAVFIGILLSGNPVVIEKGVYEIIPVQIAERKGYIIETCREGELSGLLINIKKKNGLIIPIHLNLKSDNYEIIEDGENKIESDTKMVGNFWLTFVKHEITKPYKIHIPQNSRILKYKES